MIKKSFRPNRKYMIWAMITAFIATLIFIAFGVILESYRKNQLDQSIDLYGSYHFCFHGLTDEQIDYVNHHDAVEQTALVRNIETIGKDYVCNCMCVNESLFDISEYRMVEGRFPQAANEVLVPRWFLEQRSHSEDPQVGDVIEMIDPISGENEPKVVSGIVCSGYSNIRLTAHHGTSVFFNEDTIQWPGEAKVLYVRLKGTDFKEDIVSSLVPGFTYESETITCDSNDEILYLEGITKDGKRNMLRYLGGYLAIMIVTVLLSAILIRNVLRVMMQKMHGIFEIYFVLGANMSEINRTFIKVLYTYCFCGEVLGMLLGLTIGLGASGLLGFTLYVPVKMIAVSLILEALFFFVILLRVKEYNRNIKLTGARTIFRGKHFMFVRFALRNFMTYHLKKVVNILAIAGCVVLLFVVSLVVKNQTKQQDNNDSYDYYLQMDLYSIVDASTYPAEYENLLSKWKNVRDYCISKGHIPYYDAFFVDHYDITKQNMSKELQHTYARTAQGAAALARTNASFHCKLAIMAIGPEAVAEMGMDPLPEHGAILLNRITGKHNMEGSLSGMEGAVIKKEALRTEGEPDEFGNPNYVDVEFQICNLADNIPVYPMLEEDTLCLLIDINEYLYLYGHDYASSFYLKHLTEEEVDEIQGMLTDQTHIRLLNQHEVLADITHVHRLMWYGMMTMFILGILFVYSNMQLQNIYEFDSRKNEFALLNAMGISPKMLQRLKSLETAFAILFGWLLGLLLCQCLNFVLYHYVIVEDEWIRLEVIWQSAVLIGAVSLIVMMVSAVKNKSSKIDWILKEL